MTYDKTLIYDYELLDKIYTGKVEHLLEVKDPEDILFKLKLLNEPGKGEEIGYTGFVFIGQQDNFLIYCKMENFWKATRDIELEYNFRFKREGELIPFHTRAKTRAEAWQKMKEIAGGNARFQATESGSIFFPAKQFSNRNVINGEIQCSKFSNPWTYFYDIATLNFSNDRINRSVHNLAKSYIQTFSDIIPTFEQFEYWMNTYQSPVIKISLNHYQYFAKEVKKMKAKKH